MKTLIRLLCLAAFLFINADCMFSGSYKLSETTSRIITLKGSLVGKTKKSATTLTATAYLTGNQISIVFSEPLFEESISVSIRKGDDEVVFTGDFSLYNEDSLSFVFDYDEAEGYLMEVRLPQGYLLGVF